MKDNDSTRPPSRAPEPSAPTRPRGSELGARWELVRNGLAHGGALARFTITNRARVALPATGWAIYFNQLTGNPRTPEVPSTSHARVERLSGDFHRLSPAPGFEPLAPGEARVIEYETKQPVIKEAWAPRGLYIVFERDRPEALADITVAKLERPEQIHRSPNDPIPIPTAAWRYERDRHLSRLEMSALPAVLPTPLVVNRSSEAADAADIDASWRIDHGPSLAGEAHELASALEATLGVALPVREGNGGARAISLELGTVTDATGPEAYELEVRPGDAGIRVRGGSAAGVFYGAQTLLVAFPPEALRARAGHARIAAMTVRDAPRFGYRGLMLDVARTFVPLVTVRKVIDLMALYKLNRLHLHLADDEGWRVEIAALPELTRVGARRGHTSDERDMLHPSFGSGPDPAGPRASGFYTRAELVELLRYAKRKHIEVVPEIDLPGHARAAIVAMKARSRALRETGDAEHADAFRLDDPDDRSTYESVQGYDDNVVCACRESTYRFVETVVSALAAMYREAGAPLAMFHIGGDEVPRGAWDASPLCRALRSQHPELARGDAGARSPLRAYFVRRVVEILARHGLRTGGWQEIAIGGSDEHDASLGGGRVVPFVWVDAAGRGDVAEHLGAAGFPIVICNASELYLDLAYDKDPYERGLAWAGFVDMRTVFEALSGLRGAESHILGLQAQLWTELIEDREQLERALFPRLLAAAERMWARAPRSASMPEGRARAALRDAEWNVFANAIGQRELARLDHLFGGVSYRVPPPGVRVTEDLVHANVEYPGLAIHYTRDGTDPTPASPRYEAPIRPGAGEQITVRAFDARGRGSRAERARSP